jgi:diguanylate cyclase (GGDEF)-like protein
LQQSAGPLLKAHAQDFFIDPDEAQKIHHLVNSVHDVREVEAQLKTAQGRVFTAEIAAIRIDYAGAPAILFSMNDISERKKLEAELFHQANTDSLTGLSNRRHFMFQAEQEWRRARRFGRDMSVIMMDLDHFKTINDTFGHAVGDVVLERLTRAGQESLRESDSMGRLGGEEFAILLPETDLVAAKEVAERLLAHIAETPIETSYKTLNCTTSLGVAHMQKDDESIDDLLHRADLALYHAKRDGRNRVAVQEE